MQKVLHSRLVQSLADETKLCSISQRRRNGAIAMSIMSLTALYVLRSPYDPTWIMALEILASVAMLVALYRMQFIRQHSATWNILAYVTAIGLCWFIDTVARGFGFGNGSEVLMLTSFGWLSLVMSYTSQTTRQLGLSVVCSGFLALFITCLSDRSIALLPASIYGVLCLWWLVANHWEKIASTAVVNVERPNWLRVNSVLAGIAVFGVVAYFGVTQVPAVRKLAYELMPTSGGTRYSDPAARTGIGDGEALVAAKNHASSFGNVDTNLFVDSPEPSLYDLFSEQYGVPRKKKKFQRAQALDSQKVKEQDGKLAEGRRSSSTFSTDRNTSTKASPLNDLKSNALMFWSGRTNQLLATERFYEFDGYEWSNREGINDHLHPPGTVDVDGVTWFYRRYNAIDDFRSPFVGAHQEALKFVNYRSPIIPSDAGISLWSIDMVDRIDFFNVRFDDSIEMTDRAHVPDYTVVKFVNRTMDIDRIEAALRQRQRQSDQLKNLPQELSTRIVALQQSIVNPDSNSWEQIQDVLNHFRTNYKFDRSKRSTAQELDDDASLSSKDSVTPLDEFLDSKTGDDYMFATAAALVLRSLGYDTRFVTGFYVRPRFVKESKDVAIVNEDVHTWLEINLGNGNWIAVEPTPTYRQPAYHASLWYRIKQARYQIFGTFLLIGGIALVGWLLRKSLFELLVLIAWYPLQLVHDRRKVRWLTKVLDLRMKMIGKQRPNGAIPSVWIREQAQIENAQQNMLRMFFADADRINFGRSDRLTEHGQTACKIIWKQLTIFCLKRSQNRREYVES